MDWRIKALGHWVISLSPWPDRLGHLMQCRVTKTLPLSDEMLEEHVAVAERHYRLATDHLGHPPADAYEFGAGWDLVVPLVLAKAGIRHQTVTDIRRLIHPDLVADIAGRLGVDADLDQLGITYLAPMDAMATGLPSGSYDLVTSTDTLEHVPEGDLPRVLSECRRLLRPGGILSARIDYRDHFAYSDSSIGPFHFLRYGERAWKRWNPPSHFQSRLRHGDHLSAIQDAGFNVVIADHPEPMTDALGFVHVDFDRYTRDELAVPEAWIVARVPIAAARAEAI